MSIQMTMIEVDISTAAILQTLKAKAATLGMSLDALLKPLTEEKNGTAQATDALLDWEYIAECAAEADPSVALEEVRAGLSKISGSMTEDFRRERDER